MTDQSPFRMPSIVIPAALLLAASASATLRLDPSVDKATALSLLMSARASLSDVDVTLVVDRVDATSDRMSGQQAWRLAWSPTSGRWEESRVSAHEPASLAPPATIVVVDASMNAGMVYDTTGAAAVGSAPSLHPERYIHDYFLMIGLLPMGDLVGFSSNNDAVSLLKDAGTTILPHLEQVAGYDCVIAEWRPEGADPESAPLIRAAFAPDLGFAQVQRTVGGGSGGATAQWTCEEFMLAGQGMASLPLRGTYQLIDASGAVLSERTIAVASGADGSPLLSLGGPVDTALALPAGTRVVNVDTNESWTLSSSHVVPGPVMALAASTFGNHQGPASSPLHTVGSRGLLLAGLALAGAVACATLVLAGLRRHLRRSAGLTPAAAAS